MRDNIDRLELGAAGEFGAGYAEIDTLFAPQADCIVLTGLTAAYFAKRITCDQTATVMSRREMRTLDYPGFISAVFMLDKISALRNQPGFVIIKTGPGTFYELLFLAIRRVQLTRKRRGQFYCLFAIASGAQFCFIQKNQR